MQFHSPSKGDLPLEQVVDELIRFVAEQPQSTYRLIIGTDSQTTNSHTHFVTAIVVHRVGKGGRYYVYDRFERPIYSLRQKLSHETSQSLEVMIRLKELLLSRQVLTQFELEIHVDAGTAGATRELIRDLVGLVMANGFTARVKPESFAASKVADKYTR
ncbi:MAG: ribonuclease H-like YkuK family protein [Bacillota bacterium]|jgi:predicted RNase H-related nuclease YkuK (DUF458 family)